MHDQSKWISKIGNSIENAPTNMLEHFQFLKPTLKDFFEIWHDYVVIQLGTRKSLSVENIFVLGEMVHF